MVESEFELMHLGCQVYGIIKRASLSVNGETLFTYPL